MINCINDILKPEELEQLSAGLDAATFSDGTATAVGSPVSFQQGTVLIQGTVNSESVSVVPNKLAMDPPGKFLFVADRATTDGARAGQTFSPVFFGTSLEFHRQKPCRA